jgi:DNA-binding NtrC family response regulator
MAKHRILVAWIGHSDLRALAADSPSALQKEIMARVKGELPPKGESGPIRTLLDNESFGEIILLSTYPADFTKHFATWVKHKVRTVAVKLPVPTDYPAIFEAADAELRKIRDRPNAKNVEICLHLSPGTPAMAAVWLLLGKTRYPATFYETFQGKLWITRIPFDLTLDVIPEILQDADSRLSHLAAMPPSDIVGFEDIVGNTQAIRLAVGRAQRAAVRSVSVLLLGESGTGKELIAQAMHRASSRREKPFVAINCAAIATSVLESELFGHVKGAFTGADRPRAGAFESANGGTLFLDEVGECDLDLQAKLLRVLQPPDDAHPCTRRFRPMGGDREATADVRIIAATNRDLQHAIRSHAFREDLFYRLAVITIHIPPLRERRADIQQIATRLMARMNTQFRAEERGYQDKSLSDSAISFVKRHDWPGNIRQLFNVLLQAAVMTEGNCIGRSDMIAALGEFPESSTAGDLREREIGDGFKLEDILNELQRHYLRRAMTEAKGIKAHAARLLGIDNYQTLDAQLKRLKVDVE